MKWGIRNSVKFDNLQKEKNKAAENDVTCSVSYKSEIYQSFLLWMKIISYLSNTKNSRYETVLLVSYLNAKACLQTVMT